MAGKGSDMSIAPGYPSLDFTIGDRTYFITRDTRRGNGWAIVTAGCLVDFISSEHFGEVVAFRKIALRLEEIEQAWAALQKI